MTGAAGFVLAGAASGSGKTLLATGIVQALRTRGRRIAAAKCGPDYIDPRFLEAASGRPSFNLDPWAMRPALLDHLARRAATDADILLVEGVMGVFDGGSGSLGSTADVAARLGLPTVVVMDASGTAQTLAASARGFIGHREDVDVAGFIVNRVASDRHAALVAEGFETAGLPLLGLVRRDGALRLPSRHLGLVQASEQPELEALIEAAGRRVAADIDLDALQALARPLRTGREQKPHTAPPGQRIALASDEAFGFTYPHQLEGWRSAGAEITPFSPLADEGPRLDADAVILPGGYPELHAGRIAAATRFRDGMVAAARRGAFVYGECGGYMVLGEGLVDADGIRHQMLGLLPLETSFAARRLHLGYRSVRTLDAPLPPRHRAHEFHYATILEEGDAPPLFEVAAADGAPLGTAGRREGSVMGSFLHLIDVT